MSMKMQTAVVYGCDAKGCCEKATIPKEEGKSLSSVPPEWLEVYVFDGIENGEAETHQLIACCPAHLAKAVLTHYGLEEFAQ